MAEELNPYEELGVDRTADVPTIKRAFRKRVKRAHPDAEGGSTDALIRASTSLAVLTDPAKRKIFDDTGRIEEQKPDLDGAAALQIIHQEIGTAMSDFINGGMNPAADPRTFDVLAVVRRRIRHSIQEAETAAAGGEKVIEFLKDMATRFDKRQRADHADIPGDDPIARGFRDQVEGNERQMADLQNSIRYHRLALQIVETYDFRWDKPPPAPKYKGHELRMGDDMCIPAERGQNGIASRRTELRRVALTEIDAMKRAAFTKIDRQALDLRTQVISMGILSENGKIFLESLAPVEEAMGEVDFAKIEAKMKQGRLAISDHTTRYRDDV